MTDRAAMLAAVLANPSDDTVRLAYADWLEDRAEPPEPERAEFIRVQVELARMGAFRSVKSSRKRRQKHRRLRRRERELITKHGYTWCDGNAGEGWKTDGIEKCGSVVTVRYFRGVDSWGRYEFTFARGFISTVGCDWNSWRTHAAAITAAQPIERVRLTTRPEVSLTSNGGNECLFEIGDGGGDMFRIVEIDWRGPPEEMPYSVQDKLTREIFAVRWPRITFGLPPEPQLMGTLHGVPIYAMPEGGWDVYGQLPRRWKPGESIAGTIPALEDNP